MKLPNNRHLAYCTNIHRGNDWNTTLDTLQNYTLKVKEEVCPNDPYAIGLRLSQQTAIELSDADRLNDFKKWLDKNNCYIFTINGFPYGSFHGERVKEEVYLPDWTSEYRVEYTKLLFNLLCEFVPEGVEGSVSTVPGSFKPFISEDEQIKLMHENLYECMQHIDRLSQKYNRKLHLGLEPEPACLFETSYETIDFILKQRELYPDDERLKEYIGVNYDCCHLAIQYEDTETAVKSFMDNEVRISKFHLSSAIQFKTENLEAFDILEKYGDDVYLHQVVGRNQDGSYTRYEDLEPALEARKSGEDQSEEWRVHFHIPLFSDAEPPLNSTGDHTEDIIKLSNKHPELCSHFEMETYTWEVLPDKLKNNDVVDQLTREYQWTLDKFNNA